MFDVRPLAGALGAEIHGIDLSDTLDSETLLAIRALLLEHEVIFFRDQDITPAQQETLALSCLIPLALAHLGH